MGLGIVVERCVCETDSIYRASRDPQSLDLKLPCWAQAYAFFASRSFAVLASLADSGVDLASQVVLFFCNRCRPFPHPQVLHFELAVCPACRSDVT